MGGGCPRWGWLCASGHATRVFRLTWHAVRDRGAVFWAQREEGLLSTGKTDSPEDPLVGAHLLLVTPIPMQGWPECPPWSPWDRLCWDRMWGAAGSLHGASGHQSCWQGWSPEKVATGATVGLCTAVGSVARWRGQGFLPSWPPTPTPTPTPPAGADPCVCAGPRSGALHPARDLLVGVATTVSGGPALLAVG